MKRLAFALGLIARVAMGSDLIPLGACGPLQRPYDTVELSAGTLQGVGGTPTTQLGVLAIRNGKAVRVPFQIDERVGRKIVMLDGPEPLPDDRPGRFDWQDLLVLMACDAGEQAAAAVIATAIGADAGLHFWREVRIVDPIDHHTGFVYVVGADRPPHTDQRYVEYDAAHDLVRTAAYEIGCSNTLPTRLTWGLGQPMSGNLLDGVRLRADAKLWPNLLQWSISERDGRHQMLAWRAGAVRVVRRTQHHVNIGLGINISAGTAHTYFTARGVYGPGALKLPFSPSVFFSDITAFAGADMRDLKGWTYRASGAPAAGFTVDGATNDAEKAFAGKGDWFVLQHDDSALLVQAVLSENLAAIVPLAPVYVDDAARQAPPELAPGSVPLVGFRGVGLQKLQAGRYTFQMRVAGIYPYRAGDEAAVMQQSAVSLTAEVSARWPLADAPATHR